MFELRSTKAPAANYANWVSFLLLLFNFCPFFCCFHCYKLRLNFSSPHSKWCAVWLHPSRRQKETNKTAVGAQQRLFLFPFYYYHVGVLFCPIRFEFWSRANEVLWRMQGRKREMDTHMGGMGVDPLARTKMSNKSGRNRNICRIPLLQGDFCASERRKREAHHLPDGQLWETFVVSFASFKSFCLLSCLLSVKTSQTPPPDYLHQRFLWSRPPVAASLRLMECMAGWPDE